MKPTAEDFKELLSYDPDTGVFLWKSYRSNKAYEGDIAGSFNVYGYRQVKSPYGVHLMHRVAWLMTHGRWPVGDIDHINGDRSDNRMCNLREVTRSENLQNVIMPRSDSSTGMRGVFKLRDKERWYSQIRANGDKFHLGYFDSPELAQKAYLEAKLIHHKVCRRTIEQGRIGEAAA